MKSIISFPNRGPWGSSTYRGNCSGHVIKNLLEHYYANSQPKKFIEVFSGGGTGADVANELGIKNSIHLDINNGWNALKDPIPCGSDFIFSHPPYWNIVPYSKERGYYFKDDLSNDFSYDEYIQKLNVVNAKIYQALLNGGRHAILIGDIRKNGKYYSIIKDMMWFGELETHIIKAQHNCLSSTKNYSNKNFIPIVHEHLLIFRKSDAKETPIKQTSTKLFDLINFKNVTWRDLIQVALETMNKRASTIEITNFLANSKKAKKEQEWEKEVLHVLNTHNDFHKDENGNWYM